jgi:hypothetical protein
MNKFTPGPWFRDRVSGYHCDVRAGNGRKVASTAGLQNFPTKQGDIENDANAILIAAAPDMLEVLESLFRQVETSSPEIKRAFNFNEITNVIKKAKGQIDKDGADEDEQRDIDEELCHFNELHDTD